MQVQRKRIMTTLLAAVAIFAFAAQSPAADPPQSAALKLEKGDRIAIIGNALPDLMQHYGWLETAIYAVNPELDLVIRNIAFSGDEVEPKLDGESKARLRSKNFGSPKDWHTRLKTNVVFAFYGYNESFAGPAGLEKFKSNLDGMLKALAKEQFDGKANARVVLFSPIAHENLKNPDLTDGSENNKNLALYSKAIGEVAKANNVPFVDLFAATQELYAKGGPALTTNGVHANAEGTKQIGQIVVKQLFPGAGTSIDSKQLDKLQAAVMDKSWHWFQRYRVQDGFNVYGGRSTIKYVGITNAEVCGVELEMLDVMTANRDKKIWAAAVGKEISVDDSNTPPRKPVPTNKPGKGPNGAHTFISGAEALKEMEIAPGFKVNLFASEEMFKELVNPVQMAWDTKGRLWVAVWPGYPHWEPKTPYADKVLIFEDTNGDGKADKVTTFADNLQCPTGFEFYNGGILIAQSPDLWFMKDTNGDDKADKIERVMTGMDSADSHHAANSFSFDPGGALYFQEGTFHHSQVETPYGPAERSVNGAVWRFEPRTFKSEVYMAYSFANPHGHAFDRWGIDIITDGTGAVPYYGPAATTKKYYPDKSNKAPTIYKQRTRPCPASDILSSSHFPDDYQQNYMVPNVIGIQGILRYKLIEDGGGMKGEELQYNGADGKPKPWLTSKDPNFRPSDLEIGPDGALYFTDWHNPIIGHLQHHLRDPSRDARHGRIYRITAEGRPLIKPAPIAGQSIPALLENLKSPEDRVRYRTKIELSSRDTKEVIPAVQKWAASLDKSDKEYDHQLCEALWVHSWHNVVNEDLLKQVLTSKNANARAAGTRVLCYWRDRVASPLVLLKKLAADDNPRVRLEAVRACSYFKDPAAVEAALESANKPEDKWVKYVLDETMKTLDKVAK